jgi:hypothetical protein
MTRLNEINPIVREWVLSIIYVRADKPRAGNTRKQARFKPSDVRSLSLSPLLMNVLPRFEGCSRVWLPT